MSNILLLNGPNLNLLGQRETEIYGEGSLSEIETQAQNKAIEYGHKVVCRQTNSESELIEAVQRVPSEEISLVIINPGAYTHTSIALRDAFLAVSAPFIEVHISNIFAREGFRHKSYLSDIAIGVISGLGIHGYHLAILAADNWLTDQLHN
jgi:3-dehydroquinate dehydratase-2